jgi:hypothetical protein
MLLNCIANIPVRKIIYLSLNIRVKYVIFQAVTAASMKIRAFWHVAPCSLVGVYRRFSGAYYLNLQGGEFIALDIEAVCTSETSVYSNGITRRYIP